MRVERSAHKREGRRASSPKTGSVGDSEVFRAALEAEFEKSSEMEAGGLCDRVFALGEELLSKQSLEGAIRYRDAVRLLVERIVRSGLSVSTSEVADRFGRRKLYSVLREIDAQLLQLLASALERQQAQLGILDLLGEVKGLLVSVRR